jgi:hypothetical protein
VKLWLDDVRPAPEGWRHVKNAMDAIAFLQTGLVTEASLDYDVQWSPPYSVEDWENNQTGFAVVRWMAMHDMWPAGGVAVHSANVAGAERMREVIDGHYIHGRRFPTIPIQRNNPWRFPDYSRDAPEREGSD